jgi:lipopolysaccharide export system permease protein
MILRRYVVGSLVGPFLLGFGIVTFLLTMEMFLDLLDLLLNKGIDPWTVTRLFVFALGWMVALSVPCGVLVSTLMTYGRLSQDNEIIALRASGVHLMTLVNPALGLSVIVAIALTLFNNYILPETNYAYASLLQDVSRKHPTAEIREGVLIDDFRGYDLWIGRLNDRTGAMEDVLILDGRTRPQAPRTILARNGTLKFRPESNVLTLELQDGEIHEADPNSPEGEYRRLSFTTQTLNITNPSDQWTGTGSHQRGQREMSVQVMREQIRQLRAEAARQDSLIQSCLLGLPAKSIEELDRLDPSGASPSKAELLLGSLGRILSRPRTQPPRIWTPDEKRSIELIRVRQEEQRTTLRKIREYQVEIQKKFSIPLACIIFVLVGAPLGVMARRGGLAAGYFSVIFFIFYYICLVGGESLADRLILPPWLAMQIPNIILGGLGVALTMRAIVSGQPARRQRKEQPA